MSASRRDRSDPRLDRGSKLTPCSAQVVIGLQRQPDSAEVPKYLASRNAVSAVMLRLSCTISLIRPTGTSRSGASLFWLTPFGSMNSRRNISPGGINSRRRGFTDMVLAYSALRNTSNGMAGTSG
jgi:hypothetical protein